MMMFYRIDQFSQLGGMMWLFMCLIWLVILIDLILLGVWLGKQISKK